LIQGERARSRKDQLNWGKSRVLEEKIGSMKNGGRGVEKEVRM